MLLRFHFFYCTFMACMFTLQVAKGINLNLISILFIYTLIFVPCHASKIALHIIKGIDLNLIPTFICLHIDLFILHSQLTHFHCTQPRDNLELFVFTKLITMTNCKFDLTCVKFANGNYFGCKTLNAWVHRYRCVGAQK